jgi:hypothetical protein
MTTRSVIPVTAEIVTIGAIATLTGDIWQRVLQALGGPPVNWGPVGRWVAGFSRGTFVHRPITASPRVPGEDAIGWGFHYAVGVAYAALYLAIMKLGLHTEPTFISALAFALALLIAPWFIMQPALGLGFMASRTPNPTTVRVGNVFAHAVFGLGLYLGTVVWSAGAG